MDGLRRASSLLLLAIVALPASGDEGRLRLAEPSWLSPSVRRTVRARMSRHEAQMSELVWAVMLLDYPLAERSARAIANAPPALAPTDELKQLTPDFFAAQDQLKRHAARLATAARDRNDLEMSAAYTQIAETCVACHAAYVRPPADR